MDTGEYLITHDPHEMRNGYRWQVVNSKKELKQLIKPYFLLEACCTMDDDYFGYLISDYWLPKGNNKIDRHL